MGDIVFRRGEFISFRATIAFHLGDFEKDLQLDEVVEFDGSTMKMGPDTFQYSKLRGAIAAKWLVPIEDETTVYRPQPAGIEVRPAESRGRDRGPARVVGVVADEERDVGNRSQIRNAAARPLGQRDIREPARERGAGTGARPADKVSSYAVIREAGTEGQVVGRGNFSVKAGAGRNNVDIGAGEDRQFKQAIEKRTIDRVVSASTGDVDEAIEGDDLEDLLPNAVSSGRPGRPGGRTAAARNAEPAETPQERANRLAAAEQEAAAKRAERMSAAKKAEASAGRQGEFGEEATVGGTGNGPAIRNIEARVSTTERTVDTSARVSSGSTSVGTADDGHVVGRVGQRRDPRIQPQPAQRVAATPAAAPRGPPREPDPDPSDEPDIDFESEIPEQEPVGEEPEPEQFVEEVAADAAGPPDAEADAEQVPPAAIIAAKIEMIQQFVPGFQWDMTAHWRTRVKKALEQKGNMPVFNAILSIEVPSVRKHVMQELYGT